MPKLILPFVNNQQTSLDGFSVTEFSMELREFDLNALGHLTISAEPFMVLPTSAVMPDYVTDFEINEGAFFDALANAAMEWLGLEMPDTYQEILRNKEFLKKWQTKHPYPKIRVEGDSAQIGRLPSNKNPNKNPNKNKESSNG
jgi:hypothetical protein